MEKSNVVIVGGVAAGPKTAASLARRRPDWKITLFEKGEHISYGTCGMPWFASGDIPSFATLTETAWGVERTPEFFRECKGFEVVTQAEVVAVNRERKTVTVRRVDSGETFEHGYDKLVLATGSTPNKPPFECPECETVRHFTRPSDAIAFRRLAEQGKIGDAVIIGGGFIGCELADAASSLWGIETRLIERESELLPYALDDDMAIHVSNEMARNDVQTVVGVSVQGVNVDRGRAAVEYSESDENPAEGDYVFLCVGVHPETKLAQEAGLAIGATGGIKVNEHMQTSDPDIYAAGDCVESDNIVSGKPMYLPMGSLANRHGRVVAEHIATDKGRFPGVVGAMVVKVFDLNVGAVGLSERAAAAAGIKARAVVGSFTDRPDYYLEHESITVKLVYDPSDMRLLGLQAVGKGDILRRVDVFSAHLVRRATVYDLLDFEHAYSPPYAEALDPLHHLAAMAQAQEAGVEFVNIVQALDEAPEDALWLDVRETAEVEATPMFTVPTGRCIANIPLGNLRSQLDKMDRNRDTYLVCRRGPRAYQAALLLQANGFARVRVVGGGTTAMEPFRLESPSG